MGFKKPLPLFNWENIHTEIICYNADSILPQEVLSKFERYTSINRNYGFFQTTNYIVNYRASQKSEAGDFTAVLYVPKKYIYRQLGDVTLLFTVLLTVMIVFLSIFVLFYVNSLTRIIKLEESTKRERELLRINHLITTERVSESIVHNINNPLTAAKGFLELSTAITLAPMLGFLGTVSGMISAFDAIAAARAVDATIVASGIKIALITTQAGLIVAIPVQFFNNIFTTMVDGLVIDMQRASEKVIEALIES